IASSRRVDRTRRVEQPIAEVVGLCDANDARAVVAIRIAIDIHGFRSHAVRRSKYRCRSETDKRDCAATDQSCYAPTAMKHGTLLWPANLQPRITRPRDRALTATDSIHATMLGSLPAADCAMLPPA